MRQDAEFMIRRYRLEDRAWVLDVNVRHYLEVEAFSSDFAAKASEALDAIEAQLEDSRSGFWIAEAGERRVGSVFFCPENGSDDDRVGRLRLFYLAEDQRGRGRGKRLLRHAMQEAAEAGCAVVRVSTYDRHRSALALYAASGFRRLCEAEVLAFGRQMRRIDLECELPGPRQ